MALRLTILNKRETAKLYWFRIRLQEPGGPIIEDNFAWTKQKAWVYTGLPVPEPATPGCKPDRATNPSLYQLREKNKFSYDEIVQVAVHQFMRMTGRLDRSLVGKGFTWPSYPFQLVAGRSSLADELATRGAQLVGAQLELTIELPQTVFGPPRPPADVIIISDDYDATFFYETGGPWGRGDFWNLMMGLRWVGDWQLDRMCCRFPLASLHSLGIVQDVDFKNNCVTAGNAAGTWDVHPYNDDGQANPLADAIHVAADRCNPAGTPYLDELTDWRNTGIYTMQLPSAAITDVQNAKSAVSWFTLAGHEEGEDVSPAMLEELEAAGTDEPKLIITAVTTGPFPTHFRV